MVKHTTNLPKKTKLFTMLILTLIIALISACGDDNTDKNVGAQADTTKITKANESFAFSLLKDVTPDSDGNIFISPTSALIAMLMVYNGADETTKSEIEAALLIEGLSTEEINDLTKLLLENMQQSDKKIDVSIANSLWINDQFAFQKDFATTMNDIFHAEIDEIAIHDNQSADRINDWVKKETNGLIEEIVEAPLPADLITYIINALYFNGTWKYEFDKNLTIPDLFFAENGEIELPFMTIDEEFDYFETDELQAVKLPYGDGEMNMQLFLPEGDSVDNLLENLDADAWQQWQKNFSMQEGTVRLPKFKLEYETILNDSLVNLGIVEAFEPEKANFTKMVNTDRPVYLSEVKQKTAIEVDEKGTEAAAITNAQIRTTSAPLEDETFYMDINRPFILTIYDEKNDHILFAGIIKTPKGNESF